MKEVITQFFNCIIYKSLKRKVLFELDLNDKQASSSSRWWIKHTH